MQAVITGFSGTRPCLSSRHAISGGHKSLRSGRVSAVPRLPAAPARRRAQHIAAVLSADPAALAQDALFLTQQLNSFIFTLAGFAAVGSVVRATFQLFPTRAVQPAAASELAGAPAASAAEYLALAQDLPTEVEQSSEPDEARLAAPVAAAAASLADIGAIRAELQQTAAAAVAAIRTEAAAPTKAPRAAPTPSSLGAAVRLTAEDATRQVNEWIAAWGAKTGEEMRAEPEVPALAALVAAADTDQQAAQQQVVAIDQHKETENPKPKPQAPVVNPAAAVAVLDALTANAPVGISSGREEGSNGDVPGIGGSEAQEERVLAAVAAEEQAATAAADHQYRERIAAALADSPLAGESLRGAAAAAEKAAVAEPTKAVAYEEKIEALRKGREERLAAEEALLARSEALLAQLAQQEEAERQVAVPAAAPTPTLAPVAGAQQQPAVLQRVQAFFQTLRTMFANFVAWVKALISGTRGDSSAASPAAA